MKRVKQIIGLSMIVGMLFSGSGCMYVTAAKIAYKVGSKLHDKMQEDQAAKAKTAGAKAPAKSGQQTQGTLTLR